MGNRTGAAFSRATSEERYVSARSRWAVTLMASVATIAFGAPAFAQQTSDADSGGASRLEEIVVTARRVEENLQEVPVAVTAFSGEQLRQQNVARVSDVARVTPGFVIKPSSPTAAAVNLQLRGQYQNELLATVDPSVGTYVDGYYWARAYGLNTDLLDVRSVQVLRGPQGTLFGRNTTGGALLIETNNPRLDAFSGSVAATYGRYNERSMTGVLNVPLAEDRLAVRFAGGFMKRDGYLASVPFVFNGRTLPAQGPLANVPFAAGYRGVTTPRGSLGRKTGDRDTYVIRGKLLFKATDDLSITLSAEQYRFASFGQDFRAAVLAPSSPVNIEAGLELGGTLATATAIGQSFFAAYLPFAQQGDHLSKNEDNFSYAKTQTYLGTATYDTSIGQLKYIGGLRKVKAHANIDLDGSPIFVLDTLGEGDFKQYSHELQMTGKVIDDRLDYAAGVFYFKETGTDRSHSVALPLVSTLAPGSVLTSQIFRGDIDTKSAGVYAQGTWKFSDRLNATAGIRYSEDDKGITSYNRNVNAATGALFACSIFGANTASQPEPCQVKRSDKFDGVSYTAGISYKLNDDTMVYAKTSKGFRSGGQNLRAVGTVNSAFVPFRPEVSREHEVGFKSEMLDRRVRLNVAAFYNKVQDIQRTTIITFVNPLTNAPGTTTIAGNAGRSRNYGGEAELTALVTDELTISANAAHVHPKYVQFSGISATGAPLDRRGERFDQVPKWTANLSANYARTYDFGKVSLTATYAWQGTTPVGTFNFATDAAGVTRDVSTGVPLPLDTAKAFKSTMTQKAGGQLDLRGAVTIMDGKLELAAWGRNVNNFRPNIGSLYFSAPLLFLDSQKRDPATYGVTATYRFGAD